MVSERMRRSRTYLKTTQSPSNKPRNAKVRLKQGGTSIREGKLGRVNSHKCMETHNRRAMWGSFQRRGLTQLCLRFSKSITWRRRGTIRDELWVSRTEFLPLLRALLHTTPTEITTKPNNSWFEILTKMQLEVFWARLRNLGLRQTQMLRFLELGRMKK